MKWRGELESGESVTIRLSHCSLSYHSLLRTDSDHIKKYSQANIKDFIMDFIIDVQGFKRSFNEFVVKELAIISLERGYSIPQVYHFQPPCTWESLSRHCKRSNGWLKHHHHGLVWNSGDIPYESLDEILSSSVQGARRVFVKGLDKMKWLSRLLPDKIILNLEDMRCPPLRQLNREHTICRLHNSMINPICALDNVRKLKTWFLWRFTEEDDGKDETGIHHDLPLHIDDSRDFIIRIKFRNL